MSCQPETRAPLRTFSVSCFLLLNLLLSFVITFAIVLVMVGALVPASRLFAFVLAFV